MQHVLSGLIKYRAELAGKIDQAEAQLNAMISDLIHVDATIRQFDPDIDLSAIPGKRPRPVVISRGATARAVLAMLRNGPASTAELAVRYMEDCGMDISDRKLVNVTTTKVRRSLERQRDTGVLSASQGRGGVLVWEINR